DSVGASVWDSVWASVRDSVWDSVRASVKASVGEAVWGSVGASVWDSVWDSVGEAVRESVRESVWASVGEAVRDSVWEAVYGQNDASWLAFYDFFNEVCVLKKQTKSLYGLWLLAKSSGWVIPYKKVCFMSERYNVCKLQDGVIHCDGGPAISYPDGFSVWALHGVRVPQWLAESRDTEINPNELLKIKNVEQRREFVRKIGLERICYALKSKVIDKSGDYELLLLDIGDNRKRPYLKMLNPSIGTWHIEGVHPDCITVQQAINYRRFGTVETETNWSPTILT
ncbi:MAG: hypothetical protein KKD44_25720, partial [Proteobacteria bacterium]|nr:hypothetical protein [Pseudomonadota bacterium]